jgi:hypothetical protein
MIGLPTEMAKELKLKEGDRVRITNSRGASEISWKSMPELSENMAFLFPDGTDILPLLEEIFPSSQLLHAKIEKA